MEFSSYDWKHSSFDAFAEIESPSSSELSAILNNLDTDPAFPKMGALPDFSPLGFCDAFSAPVHQMPDIDPVLLYINDLLMAEETGIHTTSSQQRGEGPLETLCEEGDFPDPFSGFPSAQGPDEGPKPCLSKGTSNCDLDEMESWINEIIEVASQAEEQSCLTSPGCSAIVSLPTPGNGFPEMSFLHDISLENLDDILDKVINDSVPTTTNDVSKLEEHQKFQTQIEEAEGNVSKSASVGGENGSRWASMEAGKTGSGQEHIEGTGGRMQTTLMGAEARKLAKHEEKDSGSVAREVTEALVMVAAAASEREEERERTAAQKKGGGWRGSRRRGERQRLRVAEPSVVDLRTLLVNCAQAVSSLDTSLARKILNDISRNATPLGNGMQRLAHYFAEGLAARLFGRATAGNSASSSANNSTEAERILRAYHTFVAVCPFLKLSHFAANDAILNAARGAHRLHILDFNILYGFQWPCFIRALAERAGGPPILRITAIDIPSRATTPYVSPATTASRLAETGHRLAGYANLYGVPFEYRIWERHWQEISANSLRLQPGEVLVVNCIHRLRHLMDETMVAPPANPRKALLTLLRRLNPHLFVEGIVNATYNVPFFLSRFREALFHYSSFFDALDATVRSDLEERLVIEKEIMGREILDVVAFEGMDRLERPETYRQWQLRTQSAGFELLPLDPVVKCKAQALAHNFYHKDYGVEYDDEGHWLLLGWKGRILHGISTWRPSSSHFTLALAT